jgi:late competence protein required for DNA uptake (superfamily II DNA/RNA helicase)
MMNDHLISRSRFLDALVLDADNKTDLIQVHHALEKAVISPDDVRGVGEWMQKEVINLEDITIEQMQSACCSVCGKYHTTPYSYYFSEYNYCPNCGARMKGASEDA